MQTVLSQLPPFLLAAAYAFFWTWEGVAAARDGSGVRLRRSRNLVLSLATFLLGGLSGAALLLLAATAADQHWGLLNNAQLPFWAAVVCGILAVDFADYWRHRVSHSIPALWRLHRVHHSDSAVDVTTSMRNHPIEMALRPAFLGLAVVGFGVPPVALLILPVLQLPVLVFQHANVTLPLQVDRALALLIVTPGMHLVHHSRASSETNSNYATFLTVWDHLFLSFRRSVRPEALGLDGHDGARHQSIAGLLLTPWR